MTRLGFRNALRAVRLATLPLLLLLSGCGLFTSENGPLEEARSARRRWQQAGLSDYTFDLHRTCFCTPQKIRIRVAADTIESATHVDSGQPVEPDPGIALYTIDELFDWLIGELREEPATTRVWYDPVYHFPAELYVDHRGNIVDDEVWIEIRNFQKH